MSAALSWLRGPTLGGIVSRGEALVWFAASVPIGAAVVLIMAVLP